MVPPDTYSLTITSDDATSRITIQGPRARAVLRALLGTAEAPHESPSDTSTGEAHSLETTLISRDGETLHPAISAIARDISDRLGFDQTMVRAYVAGTPHTLKPLQQTAIDNALEARVSTNGHTQHPRILALAQKLATRLQFDVNAVNAYLTGTPHTLKPLQRAAVDNVLDNVMYTKPTNEHATAERNTDPSPSILQRDRQADPPWRLPEGCVYGLEPYTRQVRCGPPAWMKKMGVTVIGSADKMQALYKEGKLWGYLIAKPQLHDVVPRGWNPRVSHEGRLLDPNNSEPWM